VVSPPLRQQISDPQYGKITKDTETEIRIRFILQSLWPFRIVILGSFSGSIREGG